MLSLWLVSIIIFISSALADTLILPINQGTPYSSDGGFDTNGTDTDTSTISDTIAIVDQKASVPYDAAPELPIPDTVVSAVDGHLTGADVVNFTSISLDGSSASANRRNAIPYDFLQVFAGSDTDKDCSVEGTSYLTYKLVSNATYSVDECVNYCASVDGCVFANLYYEYNNPLLDFVFSEKSNLKCALFGDVHTAAEKTNCGGQQLEEKPAGLTYMKNSTGYALSALISPETPEGYDLVFGPTGGANNAPGYMGFVLLSRYDVAACALQCEARPYDAKGGVCQYFNIWRAVVDDKPQSYTCSLYYLPTDLSTAVNYGQGNLKVTYSRGYRRRSAMLDGDFESYLCPNGGKFCYAEKTQYWSGISSPQGTWDAMIFHNPAFSYSGNGVGLLGSGSGSDGLPGTITPVSPLSTIAGKTYVIQFFHNSAFYAPAYEADAFVDVKWNGETVLALKPGFQHWTYYQLKVVAKGNDILEFYGGKYPAYSFIDDIFAAAVSA